MNVAIYIYDEAEVLDFTGPYEVFITASRIHGESPFNVFLVSEKLGTVTARGNFSVNSHYDLSNCPGCDVLIIPGGLHSDEMEKERVLQWIRETSSDAKITASVCTGVFLLAASGVVTEEDVTTHHEDMDDLKNRFPGLNIVKGCLWVDKGSIITSGGISAGIDMSLHIVSRIFGEKHAERTARQMEYDWRQ